MQPSSREMQGMAASLNGIEPQIALQDLQNGHALDHSAPSTGGGGGGGSGHDDFFDQMLSGLPAGWPELGNQEASVSGPKLFNIGLGARSPEEPVGAGEGLHYAPPYDESSLLESRFRQYQISSASSPTRKPMMLQLNHHSQQHMLLSAMGRSPTSAGAGDPGLLPLPLTLGSGSSSDAPLKSPAATGGEGLFNGYGGSIPRGAQEHSNQQHFHHPQGPSQDYGGAPPGCGAGQAPAAIASTASGSAGCGSTPPRQRVRARRGQATDPHSIAERLRRERIAERMKALQELVPNANKTDKASMLDEIIDYVKFLQLQVKVLSMSRLGRAAAVAPLVADMSSESGGGRKGTNGAAGSDVSLTMTEHQVAKLMEEDMGSAMQYLQGKGLCLMPISLASAISSATCHPRPSPSSAVALLNHGLNPAAPPQPPPAANTNNNATGNASPSSPSMSVLTMQSAMANGASDADGSSQSKDSAAASKP